MIAANDAKNRLLRENPEKDIETFSENKHYFIFSLRHKAMPRGSATGGACYLVDKVSGKVIICIITDPRANQNYV